VDPEIHIRFGRGEGTLAQHLRADNGFLYVSNLAIGPPAAPSLTYPFMGCSQFVKAMQDAGLSILLDGLRTTTMFVPNDEAFANANMAQYSPSQVKAILLYHIVPRVVFSSQMQTGQLTTLLEGNTVPVRSSNDGADVGSGPTTGRFSLADNFVTTGIAHRIAFVMVPPNLPARDAIVNPTNIPAGSITTSEAPRPTTGTNGTPTGSGTTKTNAANIASTIGSYLVGLAGLVAL
jgi:hypothetical protein